MRRKDREITDPKTIDSIIQSCSCIRLGLSDGCIPYIVPLNFGFSHQDSQRVFYFHGANTGRKLDLIATNPWAGFELDTDHHLNQGDLACDHSYRFQSVIGTGLVSILTDPSERRFAMNAIMLHYTGRDNWEFDEALLARTALLKLVVHEFSCKAHA